MHYEKAGGFVEMYLLGGDKLKVYLTRRDLDDLGLDYDTMEHSDDATKLALIEILQQAKDELGFSPKGAKLFIEVYKTGTDGYTLYFTGIRRTVLHNESQAVMLPVIFEFDNADSLIEGASKLFEKYSHRIYKSSLYAINGRYRLFVYNLDYSDMLSIYFLSEYGEKLGSNEFIAAYTEEHGKLLIEDDALDTLSRHFG